MGLKHRWLAAGMIAISAWSAAATAQTKLLVSLIFAPSHAIYSQVMVPWAKDVEKATNGEVSVEFSPSSLAPPPGQLDMVSKGIADVAIQFSGVVPNRLSLTLIAEQFGPMTTSQAMSVALWRTHKKFFEQAGEYEGFKLLSLVTFPAQRLYIVNQPITSLDQLKRSKIAVTPGTLAKAYGSVSTGVVAVPAVRFFELVSKGTVDAFIVTPIEIYSFNLREFTKYVVRFKDTGTAAAAFAVVMNESRWKSLSRLQRDAIERLSGEAFAMRMSALDEVAESASAQARRDGVRFVDAPPAFNDEVRKAFAFTVEEWIAAARKRGVDGRAALEFYQAEHVRLAGTR